MINVDQEEKLLSQFVEKFPKVNWEKNQVVLKPGDRVEYVYYLEVGFIRQYLFRNSKQEMTIHIFKPGALMPLLLTLVSQPEKFYFQAMISSEARKIPVDKLHDWLGNNPQVWKLLAKNFSEGILGLTKRVEVSLSRDAYHQVVSLLIYLASRIGTSNGYTKLSVNVTHQEIADWLGLARETVSRQIEIIKKKNLVEYHGHQLFIKDLEGLEKELS